MNLENKRIIIAITGGIAVYKTCELLRQLQKRGAIVRVVMTESATKFVTPLTYESLSGHEVAYEMFPENTYTATKHIDWADWADLIVIVPATANTIAKLANGFSDNLLTTIVCAFKGPKVIAPAMNSNMWANPIVQKNLNTLEEYNYYTMPTEIGELACGWVGEGRLAPWEHIIQYACKALSHDSLNGKHVVITSGPTVEDIDPVRYLSNRSTGKMGNALAYAAWCLGAKVTLISGEVSESFPFEINIIQVRSAKEMFTHATKQFEKSDLYISAAAVADYTPAEYNVQKLKKSDNELSIPLKRTNDILKSLRKKEHQKLIGFAVETENEEQNTLKKMDTKNLDFIVLNNPNIKDSTFGADTNVVTLFSKDGLKESIPKMSKLELAFELFYRFSK